MATPDIYLGAKVTKVTLPNGVSTWELSPSQYVQEAVKQVKEYLMKNGERTLSAKASTPMASGYRPKLDVSVELNPADGNYYQSLNGVPRWAVELGRFDITTEMSMLSSNLTLPRQGHMEQVFHVFSYLAIRHNTVMVFDPSYPEFDESRFVKHDWGNFYGKVKETIPPNAPLARGKEVVIRCFVDADHAGDKLTRRSYTGIITYMNMAPIV